uniref:Uncharacterized protein n=1 Tax=Anopheles atroparvus TaxID=41427 RepID=A0A182IJP0_ANOAO
MAGWPSFVDRLGENVDLIKSLLLLPTHNDPDHGDGPLGSGVPYLSVRPGLQFAPFARDDRSSRRDKMKSNEIKINSSRAGQAAAATAKGKDRSPDRWHGEGSGADNCCGGFALRFRNHFAPQKPRARARALSAKMCKLIVVALAGFAFALARIRGTFYTLGVPGLELDNHSTVVGANGQHAVCQRVRWFGRSVEVIVVVVVDRAICIGKVLLLLLLLLLLEVVLGHFVQPEQRNGQWQFGCMLLPGTGSQRAGVERSCRRQQGGLLMVGHILLESG